MAEDMPSQEDNSQNPQGSEMPRKRGRPPGTGSVSPPTQRVSFTVNEDGRPAWDRITPDGRVKMARAFTDPQLPAQLGIDRPQAAAAQAAAEEGFDADMAGGLFDGLTALNVMIAKRAGFVVDEEAIQTLAVSHEEAARLGKPTAAVLDQYLGEKIGKHKAAVILATMILGMELKKFRQLRREAQVRPFPQAAQTQGGSQ